MIDKDAFESSGGAINNRKEGTEIPEDIKVGNKDSKDLSMAAIGSEIDTIIDEFSSSDKSPFPVKIFPREVVEIINSTNESLDFPLDYIGPSLLVATSIAIGNTYKAEIKAGFQENAMIYLALCGRAGTNKTHPLKWALAPIRKKDQKSFKTYQAQKEAYDKAVLMSKKERDDIGMDEPEKPHWIKYLLSDFTPEALVEVHKNNRRGIGIYVDELASWFKAFGRYTKGAEVEFWLSAWSGSSITVDRKGSEPTFIGSPYIPVVGSMQPSVLKELGSDNRGSNGFLDRILFVMNQNIKKHYWSDKELDEGIPLQWFAIIENILATPYEMDEEGNFKSRILKFKPEAKKQLYQWQHNNANECNAESNDSFAGVYSKLEMYAIRFSLILEVLSGAIDGFTPTQISAKSVEGAIALVTYFKSSALRVRAILDEKVKPVNLLPKDKQDLFNKLPNEFETKTAIELGATLSIPKRTVHHFLKTKDLFVKVKTGHYKKK